MLKKTVNFCIYEKKSLIGKKRKSEIMMRKNVVNESVA